MAHRSRLNTALLRLAAALIPTFLLLWPSALGPTGADAAIPSIVTLDVDTFLDDGGPGYQACTPIPGDCSLRGAISRANSDPTNSYHITLPTGIYQLMLPPDGSPDDNADGDLDILGTVEIHGSGAEATIIQAGANQDEGIDRLFDIVDATGDLTLQHLTLRYGRASGNGGAIRNAGNLTVEKATVTASTALAERDESGDAVGGKGGGIYSRSHATIRESTISESTVAVDGMGTVYPDNVSGSGLFNDGGTMVITTTLITGNATGYSGGGLYSAGGTVTISATQVTTNTAGGSAGIYIAGGSATVDGSTIAGNTATYFGCAGIKNLATLTLADTTIHHNSTPQKGGGICNEGGELAIAGSTISSNTAGDNGGGIYCGNSLPDIADSRMDIVNSTLSENTSNGSSGGGVYGTASFASTVINLTNCTLRANTATTGGGIATLAFLGNAAVRIENTIVTGSTGGDCYTYGGTFDGDNNLIDDHNLAAGACSEISADAVTGLEATLHDNGPSGAGTIVKTHMLLPGSNAIDGVPDGMCTVAASAGNSLFTDGAANTQDERGEPRPVDYNRDGTNLCDIGAFERQAGEVYTATVDSGATQRFGATMVYLEDTATATAPGETTVTRFNTPPGGGTADPGELPFYVIIQPAVDTGLDLNLTLCYSDWELNGLDETALTLYRFDDPNWVEVGADVRDTEGNCVTMNHLTELSTWTLGSAAPTAVSVLSLASSPEAGLVGGLTILALGLMFVAIARRRA